MDSFIISTSDQYQLNATLFIAKEYDQKKVLIINSATGVKQQLYYAFANFLASKGITVITYDYRGIGLSAPKTLNKFSATMRDWGNFDFAAITQFIKKKFPDYSKYLLGHSVGALILGMNADSTEFEKVLFIATQNAYVGHLDFKTKITAAFGFGIAQPISTKIYGYFPAHYFGLGEDLPTGVGSDWRKLILKPTSTDYLLNHSKTNISKKLCNKCFVMYADDDAWLTDKGVKSLLETTYPNLKPQYKILSHKESQIGKIGHVNFFRSYNKNLWTILEHQILN